MTLRRLLIAAVLLAATMPAAAQSTEASADRFAVQVHAVVSQGFMLSTKNNYLTESKRGNFEFTEAGINFTKQL